jgi:hypothetical protein
MMHQPVPAATANAILSQERLLQEYALSSIEPSLHKSTVDAVQKTIKLSNCVGQNIDDTHGILSTILQTGISKSTKMIFSVSCSAILPLSKIENLLETMKQQW